MDVENVPRERHTLSKHLQRHDLASLEAHLKALFAELPHDWYRNKPIVRYESHYVSVFYSHFAALGLAVTVEDASHYGRVDLTVDFGGHLYLFEFKLVVQLPEGEALKQVISTVLSESPYTLIEVEFSSGKRQIVAFEVESIDRWLINNLLL
ncbi:PD-(D/E)XK nuclease domain-containing protein [Halomonas sp. N3-2A]|uniref:PD-(D/E)XK nuclease domain-containing protein n=1 Tax=Halomonas sp. N3-2A TaxID=2014541 RepID=UPI001E4E060C|nr:PD-(D/E)XK nuclease domain-containing protein [Halomonas sp. N3-2A]